MKQSQHYTMYTVYSSVQCTVYTVYSNVYCIVLWCIHTSTIWSPRRLKRAPHSDLYQIIQRGLFSTCTYTIYLLYYVDYMGIFQNCLFVTAWHFSWFFTYKYFSLMPGRLVFGSFVENHLTYNWKKTERKIS